MLNSVYGGFLIGISVSLMLFLNGKVTGISGIIGNLLMKNSSDKSWRFLFLLGLISGGLIFVLLNGKDSFSIETNTYTFDYFVAGFLVGFGTLLGNGCTSGHGVCGISRFSPRSILATLTFIISGIMSVLLFRILRGEL